MKTTLEATGFARVETKKAAAPALPGISTIALHHYIPCSVWFRSSFCHSKNAPFHGKGSSEMSSQEIAGSDFGVLTSSVFIGSVSSGVFLRLAPLGFRVRDI